MSDPIASVQDRFDRAQEHFDEIKTRLRAYYAADPYVIYGEVYFNVGNSLDRVFYVEPPEERVNTLIGEMLHDLRSALDHLARIFVDTTRGTPSKDSAFPARQFPPAPNAKGIRKSLLRACRRDDMIRFIDRHQPYQLDINFFRHGVWILHRMAIIDRHRHIVPRNVGLTHVNWSFNGARPNDAKWDAHTIRSDEWGSELELRITPPNANVEGTATFQIVVQEPGPDGIDNPDPVPLLDLLIEANEEVRHIITEARMLFF